jgi:hypothetical protein
MYEAFVLDLQPIGMLLDLRNGCVLLKPFVN